jgi:hypothetical protein
MAQVSCCATHWFSGVWGGQIRTIASIASTLTLFALLLPPTLAYSSDTKPADNNNDRPDDNNSVAKSVVPKHRAGDERLVLNPTAKLMPGGTVTVSNDELLLFRLAVGLHDRVQADIWAGALPLAVGGAVPFGILAAVAGGGVGVVGAVSLGLKFAILHEDATLPAVSVSYDMLNIFGAAVGAAGFATPGGVAPLGAATASANAQFNHVLVSVGKHLTPDTLLTGGLRVLDNHHFISQTAQFSTTFDGASAGALERHPTSVAFWLAAQHRLGPHSALSLELMPNTSDLVESNAVLGVRWVLGAKSAWHGIPIQHLKLRIDAAAVLVGGRDVDTNSPFVLPLPWLGIGLHFI